MSSVPDPDYIHTWKISQLVAYIAKATQPRDGVIDGALDLAVARELDRRFAGLEDRVSDLEDHPAMRSR